MADGRHFAILKNGQMVNGHTC